MTTATCEVCKEHAYKYKCPRCSKKTCSVACIKEHKSRDGCSGTSAEPTSYVSREKLKSADTSDETNVMVQRDYNFLLGMNRQLELLKRDGKAKNKRVLGAHHRNQPQQKWPRLEQPSQVIRRGVHCILVPRGMQRSLLNKSKWDKPLDMFVWSIEWCLFSEAGKIEFVHTNHRNKETDPLLECVGKAVYAQCVRLHQLEALPDDCTRQARIESLTAGGLKFYMKWLPQDQQSFADSKKLISVDPTKSIGEIFRDKTVIEYPTLFIAKDKQHLGDGYRLFDSSSPDSSSAENSEDTSSDAASTSSSSSDSDDEEPQETSSKQTASSNLIENPKEEVDEDDDEDDYTPGISLDFLVE
ncbi:LAQU0S11e02718g1_1 [Lachancea quebecensis]|uniref:LAQU0S11e02718g1_1 n=1 Tax=Lachancea quebecensis TaxID=1654605 RepID=A0A0P1KVD5_9SACH|nr:LAQU0S11e02718g1_1 [Lachancea quebecensis]